MGIKVDFKGQEATSKLRNGGVITSGVEIHDVGLGQVYIHALTSRGNLSSGHVGVRSESIPDIVAALIEMHHRTRPGDGEVMRRKIDEALATHPLQAVLPVEDEDALEDVPQARI